MKVFANMYLDNLLLNLEVVGQRSRSQDRIFGVFTIAR